MKSLGQDGRLSHHELTSFGHPVVARSEGYSSLV